MKIIEITDKKQFRLFLDAGNMIQSGRKNFISPLRMSVKNTLDIKKNPLWKHAKRHLFICIDEQEIVGRIAAIYIPDHEKYHGTKTGYFGYFDTIDDHRVVISLLSAVKKFLKDYGCTEIIGPINPSINYEMGVLMSGYDKSPYFMMNYNPEYYGGLLLKCGAKEDMRFHAYQYGPGITDDKINRVANLIKKRYNVRIQEVDYRNFNEEAKLLCHLYNNAFEGHYGFVPFSEEEFVFLANELKPILNRKLLFKLFYKEELAGFILAIPNLNEVIRKLYKGRLSFWGILKFLYYRNKIKTAKVMVAAIAKKYQNLGLGSILYKEIKDRTEAEGFLSGELSWVADNNNSMKTLIKSTGFQITKEYAIFKLDMNF